MSKEALRDAFNAGWNIGRSSGGGPDSAFDEWWTQSNETLNRSSPTGDDEWIEWDGSEGYPPVFVGDRVQVRFGSGKVSQRIGPAADWGWKWGDVRPSAFDIIAYKVVKP